MRHRDTVSHLENSHQMLFGMNFHKKRNIVIYNEYQKIRAYILDKQPITDKLSY